ncbi:MAG: lysozyme inhibitor LprI family protein [Candidatus Angelobacter sp.]
MKKNWAIVFFFIFSGTVSSRTLLAQCENAGTTAKTTNCMSKAYEKADVELNRTYKLAFKGLDPQQADNLKNAQRAWITYRDAQCNAEYAK